MFAKDLCHSQIEYLRNSIDFNRKDRAKRYHKSSIFNLQFGSGFAGLGVCFLFDVGRWMFPPEVWRIERSSFKATYYNININRSRWKDYHKEMDHSHYMSKALDLAKTALKMGEFPVGCLLVHRNRIIASGVRAGTTRSDSGGPINEIDHAEMVAFRKFYQTGGSINTLETTIYCTMEPCLMCYAAILLGGIGTIVYAYEDVMGGGTQSDLKKLAPLYRKRQVTIIPHIRRNESLALFKAFFSDKNNDYWQGSYLARYTLAQK